MSIQVPEITTTTPYLGEADEDNRDDDKGEEDRRDEERRGEAGEGAGEEKGEEEKGEGEDDDACPRPPEEEKELLFLIEFLVDAMLIKPENMNLEDMDPCLLQGQACIVLTFAKFPPMTICENDVDPCRQTGENYVKFNSGKSLMFALSESQFENPPPIYLEVEAYKMLPHGSVPNKLPIGMTKICLVELFKQVFKKVDEKPEKLPLSKSIKDNYTLVGARRKCATAEITIYIRLSCLGQNVITEFQRGMDECEPFLFKSKESKKVYECKPKDLPGGDDAEELCPPLPGWGVSSGKDCGDTGGQNAAPCCGGGNYPSYGNDLGNEEEEFDEFGTEVHGHALTIKVQKSQKRPGDDASGKSSSEIKGNQVTFQIPQGQSLCTKGKGGNKAAVYNINSLEGGKCGKTEPLQIIQGEDSPDKDVFVLRIGKKGEAYGKGKLELELRTPKVKIERDLQFPRKWDKAVNTESEKQPKKGKKKK